MKVYIVIGHWPVFRDNAPQTFEPRVAGVYQVYQTALARAKDEHASYHVRADVVAAPVDSVADTRGWIVAQFGDNDDGSEALQQAQQAQR